VRQRDTVETRRQRRRNELLDEISFFRIIVLDILNRVR
jgi:hypothetical protein